MTTRLHSGSREGLGAKKLVQVKRTVFGESVALSAWHEDLPAASQASSPLALSSQDMLRASLRSRLVAARWSRGITARTVRTHSPRFHPHHGSHCGFVFALILLRL